jgi:hypothetical protein
MSVGYATASIRRQSTQTAPSRLLSARKRAIEESFAARRRFRDLLELSKLRGSLDEFPSRLARTTFSRRAGQGRPLDAYCGAFEDTCAGDAISSMEC